MSTFPYSIPSVLADSLDLIAVHALRATVVVAVAALASLALRRASAATRHLVWTLALAGCAALPLVTAIVPGVPLEALHGWSASRAMSAAPRPLSTLVTRETARPVTHVVRGPVAVLSFDADVPPTTRSEPLRQAGASDRSTAPVVSGRTLLPLIPILWLAVALLLLLRGVLGWRRSARIVRDAVPVTRADWIRSLAQHAAALDVRPLPALGISPSVSVPLVSGVLRPAIVLPPEALTWSAERRNHVLLHELAHVRRRDLLTVAAAQIAAALYWFHPLVWHAARAQRSEAERACDDRVLHAGSRPSEYASDLLEIAAAARREHLPAAFAMARRSQLEHRLLAILDSRQTRGAASRMAVALSLIVAMGSIGVIAAARPAPEVREPAAAAIVPPARTSPAAEPTREAVTTVPVSTAAGASSPSTREPAAAAPDSPAPPAEGAVALAGSKEEAGADVISGTLETDEHSGEISISNWTRKNSRGSYKARGAVRFEDDLTDVISISSGGSLELEEQRDGHVYRAVIRPRNGGLERRFSVDGRNLGWNQEARAWLARYLIEADRGSGMLVKQRFPRLMREGGPASVLAEIGRMSSDYARAVYFHALLGVRLDDDTMERLVAQAGREIGSDYELARTLITSAEKHALESARTRAAFLAALGTIDSDYEHARVLIALVSRRDLSPSVAGGALESTFRIGSDYERARVLLAMVEGDNVKPPMLRSFFDRVASMRSDYEQSRVLQGLIAGGGLTRDQAVGVLETTTAIDSDYECANVLVALASAVRLDERGRAAFASAAQSIGSSYERNRALAALVGSASQ